MAQVAGFPYRSKRSLVNNSRKMRAERMDRFYTSGEVATKVGIPRWRLLYLIEKDLLPGPSLTVPGRRLFTSEDVERIRRKLNEQYKVVTE